jgi:uncharacterized protein YjbI with pentapeptide repeats
MSERPVSITLRANEQVTIEIKQSSTNKKQNFKEILGCNDKTLYDWLTLLSSILLPFTIAILTIVMTVRDNNEQRENRERDLEIASLRREQDRHLADQQRNETILSNYLKDISHLILKYGHHLENHKARIIASSVTLTTIQQLNTEKKQLIIRYLYRMTFINQIEIDQPFILIGADLSNIQLRNHLIVNDRLTKNYQGLFLPYLYLTNASFINLKMQYANFIHSDLVGVNFTYSLLQYANFQSAQLQDCDFHYTNVTDVDFRNANLTGANINDEQLQEVAFLDHVIFPNGSFFSYERRNYNILSMNNWIYNGTFEKNIFNRSIIINQKQKIIIFQDILLENYAKPYWIDRERIAYRLSTVMYGHNITVQILFFNFNRTFIQTDRLGIIENDLTMKGCELLSEKIDHISIKITLVETPQKNPPGNPCHESLGELRGDSGTPQGVDEYYQGSPGSHH